MKINYYVFFMLLTFISCDNNKIEFELTNGVIIKNVNIITISDEIFSPVLGNVIIQGDSILYSGQNLLKIKGTYQEIDGTGKFLIPGLIDNHVHLTNVNGMSEEHIEKYPEIVNAFKTQLPKSYLYFGFTTIIDLAALNFEDLEAFEKHLIKPDLYHVGGAPASIANGYPMNFLPKDLRYKIIPNFIFLESEAENIPSELLLEDHSPKAVVRRVKKTGAIAVKTHYEAGFNPGDPRLPVPTKSIMEDMLFEAHEMGLTLTVHGNSLEAHTFLSEVGVDVIAHGLWNWDEYYTHTADSIPQRMKDVLNIEIEKQIGYTPTLQVISGLRGMVIPEFLDDPQLTHVLPQEMIDWYKTEEGQWFANDFKGERSPEKIVKDFSNILLQGQAVLKYMADNGGNILFGTDSPSSPTLGNPPGYNGYMELLKMHESGVSLNKILASATINNAKAFHLDHLYGSIENGKRANMILLSKNPLKDITAYDSIDKVIIRGQVINRNELSNKKEK
jgi:imidazolonepropionase-like amidohydrolase